MLGWVNFCMLVGSGLIMNWNISYDSDLLLN